MVKYSTSLDVTFAALGDPTRRSILTATAAVAAVAITRAPVAAAQAAVESPDRTTLHYELEFKASPQRMYSAILDEKQFAAFSGLPAKIDPAVGGAPVEAGVSEPASDVR